MKNTLLVLVFLLGGIHLGTAQDKIYTTARSGEDKIVTDGILSEPSWDRVEWGGDFVQLAPYEGRNPALPTRFKILYDNAYLYVAIRAFDPAPDSVVKRMARRDEEEGDRIGIGIDSYHDQRTAFVFAVNASGVKVDAIVTEDGNNWNYDWDPIWFVELAFDAEGWTAEMKIPISQLRFGKQPSYTWGMQVGRYLFRKGEDSGWKLISNNAPGWVSFFGELQGIEGISPQKQMDIVPYVVADLERYEMDDEDPFLTGRASRISGGLDSKIGITNDLTLDLTVNPDFGQVEADPSVVNLTAYETFYEEKRLFFIEGRNIMSFAPTSGGPLSSDNLFYSRRIGRAPHLYPDVDDGIYVKSRVNTTILGAAKLTGKTRDGWSIGILEGITQREEATIDSAGKRRKEAVEPFTNYFLGRVQKDLNRGNTRLGGMFTATHRRLDDPVLEQLHRSAYTGGLDFYHQWNNKTYYFNGKAFFSHVAGTREAILETQTSAPRYFQRPDARHLKVDSSRTSLTGLGGTLTGGRAGNSKWPFLIWVTWRSPSLELNDLGYLYNPDIVQEIIWVGYQNYEPFSIFRNFFLNFNQWYATTFGGEMLYFGGNCDVNTRFKNHWYAELNVEYDTKGWSTSDLRGGPALFYEPSLFYYGNVETDNRKKLILGLGAYNYRGIHDHFNNTAYFMDISWRVSKSLKITLEPEILQNRQQLAYVDNVEDSLASVQYIRGKMNQLETSLTIRLNYNITPDFTIQYYGMPFVSAGDYSHYRKIVDPRADDYTRQYLEFSSNQISSYREDDDLHYSIDENRDGRRDYSFCNPDFNRFEYRSNLVARWEYRPGSTVYLVWSFAQNRYKNDGTYSFTHDMGEIFKVQPHMVFLFKLSYRFGL